MRHNLVSIIIPTYNRAHFIGETLESILAQTYKKWECIIVDDGSTDYTSELLEFYCAMDKRFILLKRPEEKTRGASACRNYGLSQSCGEFVNFFDSDDIMHPQKIELQLKDFLNFKHLPMTVCKTAEFQQSISRSFGTRYQSIKSETPFDDFIIEKVKWLTQAPIWRKDFLDGQGLVYDETLQAGQDWDFHVRALFKIKNYAVVEEVLIYQRNHSENISNHSDQKKIRKNYCKARLKIYFKYKDFLHQDTKAFLQHYITNAYKFSLRNFHFNFSVWIWKNFYLRDKEFPVKIKLKLALALISFILTRKGDFFINGLNIIELNK